MVVIITNLVITLYITQEADHVKSMEAIINIGELNYLISQLALISREFDLNHRMQMENFYTIDRFQLIINQTILQQSNLIKDYDS